MTSHYLSIASFKTNIEEFEEYVHSFYGKGGIEDIGASKEQIHKATLKVLEYCVESGESDIHGAFSSDLKLMKNILVSEFKLGTINLE